MLDNVVVFEKMNKPDIETEKMSTTPVATTFWPSTPWNDSWENTLKDPVNYILVGSSLWALGIWIGNNSPLNMGYEAPAATITSIPGFILALTGFILLGTGGSILWSLIKPEDSTGKTLYNGRITISTTPTPLISLLSGIVTLMFIVGTITFTMHSQGPLYSSQLELAGLVIGTFVFLASYPLDIRT